MIMLKITILLNSMMNEGVRRDSEASSWEKVPEEIVEMKLIYPINISYQVLETYHALLRACSRLNLIMKGRRKTFLLCVCIEFPDHELRRLSSFNSKIKMCMRKVLKMVGHF